MGKIFKSIPSIKTNDIIIAGLLFLLFFSFYFGFSYQLVYKTPIAEYDDILFEIDTARSIIDMTVFSGYHYRTEVHPIYVLLVNPIGELIGRILPSNEMTAVFINVFFGAIGVSLAYLVLRHTNTKTITALLAALLFGFSASQFYLSIIPDTASLAICTLLFSYALLLISFHNQKVPLSIWIIAGILSLGVTTTNFVQTIICYFSAQILIEKKTKLPRKVLITILYAIIVIAIVMLLAIFQKWLYPSTTLFFFPQVYLDELNYASASIIDAPLEITPIILKNFFLDAIIAPQAAIIPINERKYPAITFLNAGNYTVFGIIGLIFWVIFFAISIYQYFKNRKITTVDLGLISCLFFNLLLHSFYGIGEKGKIELFLYTGNVTALIITLFMRSAKNNRKDLLFKTITTIPLVIFISINNIIIVTQIIEALFVNM